MDQNGAKTHKQAKKDHGQYLAVLTKQSWSVNTVYYMEKDNFSCGAQWVIHSEQHRAILPTDVANHSAELCSSSLFRELAI